MPDEQKWWRESPTSCVQDRTWGRGLLTGESSKKLFWIVNTAYSQLLPVHHCAAFLNLELKTPRHPAQLGRPAVPMPHVAKSSVREFQPHCELSPHELSAVQPWSTSKFPLLSSFTALKSTAHSVLLPLGHFHLMLCLSITKSHAEREKGCVPLWTGVRVNCIHSNPPPKKKKSMWPWWLNALGLLRQHDFGRVSINFNCLLSLFCVRTFRPIYL